MNEQDDPRNLPGVWFAVVMLAAAGLGTTLALWAVSLLGG